MTSINALWHIDSCTSEIQAELVNSSKGAVKVISQYSMISTGTEKMVSKGLAPMEIFNQMKVPYGAGNFDLPIKYGYSLVGLTEDLRRVHLLHPHQDICFVKKDHIFELPSNLPFKRACLISNMETVINAVWDSDLHKEDTILINGFGNIGALLAITLSKLNSKKILVYDINPYNRDLAKKLGFNIAESPIDQFEICFNTSASEKGLQACIKACRLEGKIIELSWYGRRTVNLSLGFEFHYKRLRIISSQVSSIPKKMKLDFDFSKRKELVCEILQDKIYDQLITDMIPFKRAPKFFNNLRMEGFNNGLICLIDYEKSKVLL